MWDSPGSPSGDNPASGDEQVSGDNSAGDGAKPADDQADDEPGSFTLAVSGELLIHESVADAARTVDGWDFSPMFANVADTLRAADLAICHIETPFSRTNRDLAYFPAFRVPYQLADAVAYAGYDTCSLASNHATDAGAEGIAATIVALDRAGVAHSGMARTPAERNRLNLLTVGDATVAHLSYTYGFNNGELDPQDSHLSNVINVDAITEEARRARTAGADFVVVSMHWGSQYLNFPDAYQSEIGPQVLALPDVDLVVGHHSHVVQPLVTIGGEYLAYGLGNFLSNQAPETCQGCPDGVTDGVIIHFTVSEQPDGTWAVSDVSHTPTWVDRSTYLIEPATDAQTHPSLSTQLAASSNRTSAALAALGVGVPVKQS